jgi:hypothetical protein
MPSDFAVAWYPNGTPPPPKLLLETVVYAGIRSFLVKEDDDLCQPGRNSSSLNARMRTAAWKIRIGGAHSQSPVSGGNNAPFANSLWSLAKGRTTRYLHPRTTRFPHPQLQVRAVAPLLYDAGLACGWADTYSAAWKHGPGDFSPRLPRRDFRVHGLEILKFSYFPDDLGQLARKSS